MIYDEHSGLRDRFVGAGMVTPALAARLGLTGLAGRASGQGFDLRCDLPWDPYGELAPRKVVRTEGDVAARVAVRFDEVTESIRLVTTGRAATAGGRSSQADVRCGEGILGHRSHRGMARAGPGRA